ncbi:MAG: inositol monophosphatase [Alphaproteobacteria bacterium]|jgi:fructose-1,6-bisphosphatase/inositol monophosphatase family enzyme|nr:inositol monophosphatase [Alphaproteobacteria bacterium]
MSVVVSDPMRVMDLMKTAAAEIVLPRFRTLQDGEINEKDGGELVTIADIETEKWLTARLPDLLPGSTVVGEEAVFADESVFTRLVGDDPVWIIDPIDGTWNFANGRPTFAVMVSLVFKGEVVSGWIYEPVTGTTVMGSRGDGVIFDGEPVQLNSNKRETGIVGTAARHLFQRAEQRSDVIENVFRPNCAGHEYVLILSGERAFSAYTKLLPWDHVAGSFLVTEAGGYSSLLDGARYDFARPEGNLLTAESFEMWHKIHAIIDHEDA